MDSDDEWEDEPDGESISDSEKGDPEEETLNDENDDDGFFVPHGHLSDDELDEDERLVFIFFLKVNLYRAIFLI